MEKLKGSRYKQQQDLAGFLFLNNDISNIVNKLTMIPSIK